MAIYEGTDDLEQWASGLPLRHRLARTLGARCLERVILTPEELVAAARDTLGSPMPDHWFSNGFGRIFRDMPSDLIETETTPPQGRATPWATAQRRVRTNGVLAREFVEVAGDGVVSRRVLEMRVGDKVLFGQVTPTTVHLIQLGRIELAMGQDRQPTPRKVALDPEGAPAVVVEAVRLVDEYKDLTSADKAPMIPPWAWM